MSLNQMKMCSKGNETIAEWPVELNDRVDHRWVKERTWK